jgi:hypothetical protein
VSELTTDRELLALAAKAAGKSRGEWDYDWLRDQGHEIARDMLWNPLQNSGQALELAVLLRIQVEPSSRYAYAIPPDGTVIGADADDDLAATRLAIVRAAAEIGRSIP